MPVTVVVADDHAIVREGLVMHLSTQRDIEIVGIATNGREAVALVLQFAPRVVILDISMPELDGIEATRQILEKKPGTAIVILSMHSTAQHVVHALQAGARGYLLKESAAREIADAVRVVNGGARYLSPKVAGIVAEGLGSLGGQNPLDKLSRREREILRLVADGHSSAEIGSKLHLSPKTVDSYRSRLMQKLHLTDVAALVKFAIQHGLTTLE